MALLDSIGDIVNDVTGFPGNLSNPYGPGSVGQWKLLQGSFTDSETNVTTVFYVVDKLDRKSGTAVSQVSDGGGRRLAVYEYPYRDGQFVEDLGRKGERFSFEIKFFGDNYQAKLSEFIEKITKSKASGKLSHPVRGIVPCRFQEWEFVHKYDEWNAVTIRATFVENNDLKIFDSNLQPASPNMALRSALQTLTDAQSVISSAIFRVGGLLLLPAAIKSSLALRLSSIVGQVSRLLGQLAVTFSSDAHLKNMAVQAKTKVDGFGGLSGGTVTTKNGTGKTVTTILPPVFQVGLSPTDRQAANEQSDAFTAANQITSQQAVFAANQARQSVSEAIAEIRLHLGNEGYDIELQYRAIAIQIQQAVEISISSANANVIIYRVPYTMSLRMIAFLNGISQDRQNDIETLNPYVESVNFVPGGSVVLVPST